MKNLIIGLGGCGNNILNLIYDYKNNSYKTVSIQRDLQLLSISNVDFKLYTKDRDFEEKFNILLENSKSLTLIVGLGGTTSILYLENFLKLFIKLNKQFKVLLTMPLKIETAKRKGKANELLEIIKIHTDDYKVFNNDISLEDVDNKIKKDIGLRIFCKNKTI